MKIVDTGAKWGYATHEIFTPWDAEVLKPINLKEAEEYLVNAKPDLVLFGGGLDINPAIYNHDNVASGCDGPLICKRDLYEVTIWNMAKRLGIPTLGICRGSQFTCAMSGGALYQDVAGHGITHNIMFDDGSVMPITSTHHQMMLPFAVNHKLIAWAEKLLSIGVYAMDKKSKEYKTYSFPEVEPEIVFFPETKALAVQGHPEYWDALHTTVIKVRQLVNQYLLNGVMPNV